MRRTILVASAFVVGSLGTSPLARAAGPTVAECLAANNSSIDLRSDHKLRAARAQLLVCASAGCPGDVRKECIRGVGEIDMVIPTVVFEATDGAGKDLSMVAVTMDGEPLADHLDGTAIPVDPGEHTFSFETAGQSAVQKRLIIRESEKDRREAIRFGEPPAALPIASSGPAPVDHRLGTQKIVALATGGLAVIGLGLGSAFGLMAASRKSDAQAVCPGDCIDADGVAKWDDAKTAARLSDVFFIAGGVLLAGTAVLWFTAKPPTSGEPVAQIGLGLGGVRLRGGF